MSGEVVLDMLDAAYRADGVIQAFLLGSEHLAREHDATVVRRHLDGARMRRIAAELRAHPFDEDVVGRPAAAPAARASGDTLRAVAQVFAGRVGEFAALIHCLRDLVAHQRAPAAPLLRVQQECARRAERKCQ